MIRPKCPYIIDIEASGFGSYSYPIEIGLSLEPGQRYCTLIKPADHWTHWDKQAESVHKISRDMLLQNGRMISDVAIELNRRLQNKTVFSDGWVVDKPWIIELYAAAGLDMTFTVSALEMILSEYQMDVWQETRNKVTAELGLTRHRASNDSWIIQETYMRTLKTR